MRHRKREAFLAAARSHGTERWHVMEVFQEMRPFERAFFWTGVYTLLQKLEDEGVLESGWNDEERGSGDRKYRLRWYRFTESQG